MIRKALTLILALCIGLPLTACDQEEKGSDNKVISSKGGPPPIETPPDPGRPRPQMSSAGKAGAIGDK